MHRGDCFAQLTYGIEIIIRKLLARMALLDAGAVDEDSNLVAVLENFGYESSNALL